MEEYNKIFDQLWQHAESEIVEFKKAESNFEFDELGRYFSALSNEANLRERDKQRPNIGECPLFNEWPTRLEQI